jgi:uncharacterized protein YqgC (DUF456 family)
MAEDALSTVVSIVAIVVPALIAIVLIFIAALIVLWGLAADDTRKSKCMSFCPALYT